MNFFSLRNIKQRFSKFVSKQTNPPPLLYFLVFVYAHYPFETNPWYFEFLIFGLGLILVFACNFSFVFTIPIFLKAPPIVAMPLFLVALFFCNQKWKLYLFLLEIGDRSFNSDANNYFLAIFSFFICIEIYKSFIFRSITENIQFFTGLTAISTYYSLQIISNYFNLNLLLQTRIILVIAAASLAYTFMQYQLQMLKQINPDKIYSARIMAHYLRMIQIQQPLILSAKILLHSKVCFNSQCFCKVKEHRMMKIYYLRQLYKNAIERFYNHSEYLLFEFYIDFLMRNNFAVFALHFLTIWKPRQYFQFIGRERVRCKLEEVLQQGNNQNAYELQYIFAFEYDQHYSRLAKDINTIIKLKIQFWRQVNRQSSKVVRIQHLGKEITDSMYELNVFYNNVIKRYEKSIFLFDATALYAMYMLSTTNFKDYVELIIKNTAKLLQDVYTFQSNASETFSIQAVIKCQQRSFIDHHIDGINSLRYLGSLNMPGQSKLIYKPYIQNVCLGLCKIIGYKSKELINKQLSTIIPDGYKQVHHARIAQFLDFDGIQLKQHRPSQLLHRQLKLPIKCGNNSLTMAYLCIKATVDINEGIAFPTIVKLSRQRSTHALMDFQGKISDSQNTFNRDVVKHSEIQRYLQRLRQNWEIEQAIPEERFSIMIDGANHGVIISSPLLGLFVSKGKMKDKCPLIHIQVCNQQTIRNQTAENDRYNKVGKQINEMQKAINRHDSDSSTNESSYVSMATPTISSYVQKSSIPLYTYIKLVFLISICICIISNAVAFSVTQLPWDVTSPRYNPVNDTMNFYAIQMLTLKAVLTHADQVSYQKQQQNLNKTRISQYFGSRDFRSSMKQIASDMESAFRDSIKNALATPSQLLQPYINQKFRQPLNVRSPETYQKIFDPSTASQVMTYLDLLMVYATDLNLMSRYQTQSHIITGSFTLQVSRAQNCSYFSSIITGSVRKTQLTSIIAHVVLIIVIIVFLIPFYLLLRKRSPLHQKVFDLLVSIDVEDVEREIQSLTYIHKVLLNYKDSSEVMKMNVLSYEENIINPTHDKRLSADNQMVIGLQNCYTNNQNLEQKGNWGCSVIGNSDNQPNITQLQDKYKTAAKLKVNKKYQRVSSLIGLARPIWQMSIDQNQAYRKRKRSGDLNVVGSMLDGNKIIKEHCILYLILLSFLLTLVVSIFLKMKFDSSYIKSTKQLLGAYNDQVLFQQDLIIGKGMMTLGSQFIAKFFGASNAMVLLLPKLNSLPKYYYEDASNMYSQILTNCSNNSPVSSAFTAKYCQFDYSEVILKGKFASLFKQLVQMRYLVDIGSKDINSTSIIQNITEKVYYLDSLNIRLEEMVIAKINLLVQSLIQLGKDYKSKKLILLMVSVLWGILCFLYGIRIVFRMKKDYLKEIFMMTFLNNAMIAKNKRVESFLASIAKNTAF